ncbi:PilZ domain-containing protein [Butyrivibrio sp. WCD3002]|uniref:PilZ domain-containing protein n=1 Tax=Butyrivibrio sp. WCD3002 TaxID=1280676 RepID=UPI000405567D|nr:PilZ domain-containing protein [Butyrivibrio sp. WCD3002]
MNITEVIPGTELTVHVLIDDMPVELKTKAISVIDGSLLVEPLKYHHAPIPALTQATADVIIMPSGEHHSFSLESVIPYENWSDTYYLLKGYEIITELEEQRKAERYVINLLGKAVINYNTTVSAIIYDISIKGLSLLLGKKATAKPGDFIRLTFRQPGSNQDFEINLNVVRNFKVGTYDAVGCKMRGIDSKLMGYIISVKRKKEEARKSASKSKVLISDKLADE